uniref:DUF4216 domain-containing protein n=1 Tax=Vitis vinifera TaxID=29760 RepID=A5C0W0_VITVI|nr:hypothetical protein VITISV_006068 [Vitis vinifera]
MDRSWMSKDRRSKDYMDGIIREHLFFYGINQSYHTWYWHGEAVPSGPPTSRAERHDKVQFNDVDSIIEMVQAAHDDCPQKPENDIDVYLAPLLDDLKMLWEEGVESYDAHWKQKKAFNGEEEFGSTSQPLSGEEILRKIDVICNSWGKNKITQGNLNVKTTNCWKKKSIFFDLEYWKYIHVHHNLNVMHIEKNVCESIISTLLNIPGKTKDELNSRLDLMKMGCELDPMFESNQTYLPSACYTLSKVENKVFCQTLSQLNVPEGYCSNMRNLVSMEDLKLYGLKSHDYHALMQQLLPVSLRSVFTKHVRHAICRLSFFFNALCSKVVDVVALDKLQNNVVVKLCLLEKYFPPSFFDIMLHLTVHLVREIEDTIGNNEPISETLKWIAHGPSHYVSKYHGYVINGCRYHTKESDELRATQNSGVSIIASTLQIANAKDQNLVFGDLCFYGIITKIWDLDYTMFRIPIFKCDWVDNRNGIKVNDLGFTLVDFNKTTHKSNPFILASQTKQVFYVQDQRDPRWSVVLSTQKDFLDQERGDDLVDNFIEHHPFIKALPQVEAFDAMDDLDAICMRGDCEGIWIENKSSM